MARMTTRMMTDATMQAWRGRGLHDTMEQIHEIHERTKMFEALVWFPRLQAMVNGTDARGMSGRCRDVKVMTWCCAGRCLVQLERGGDRVTLITADDEKPWGRDTAHVAPMMGPMGVQGIDADPYKAMAMLYTVARWAEELAMEPDGKVNIGF